MVSAAALFQPGFILRKVTPGPADPLTGEPGPPQVTQIHGKGLVQEGLWSNVKETGPTGVTDERFILFAPVTEPITTMEIDPTDEFVDPWGRVWQATTHGHPRGIPGKTPEYLATRARRTKGKA